MLLRNIIFIAFYYSSMQKHLTKENMETINDTQVALLIYSVLLRSGVELGVVYNKTNITYDILVISLLLSTR